MTWYGKGCRWRRRHGRDATEDTTTNPTPFMDENSIGNDNATPPCSLTRTSALVLVVSAMVMTGSSLLTTTGLSKLSSKENPPVQSTAAERLEEFWSRSPILNSISIMRSSPPEHSLENPSSEAENEQLIISSDRSDNLQQDAQHHRRLKRLVKPNQDLNTKIARKKARAKANSTNQRRDDFSLSDLPPLLHWENEPAQLTFFNDEAEARYQRASKLFSNEATRLELDPLRTTKDKSHKDNNNNRVPFTPQVKYLGVLVDAGRHHFPIDWLKRLIIYLHKLRFNMIHFRLTDDQNFNIQLESYPQLAFLSQEKASTKQKNKKTATSDNKNQAAYTPSELKELVAFARDHGIAIIPEINLPGHAGAWAGIPGLVLTCPVFLCNRGYGIPLNIDHPNLKSILKGVLREIIMDIFDHPPLIHLGGDEVFMANKCFEELRYKEPFNYSTFENQLRDIVVHDIGYPEEQILRWEETGPSRQRSDMMANSNPGAEGEGLKSFSRTGKLEHAWYSLPGSRKDPDTGDPLPESVPPRFPVFVSRGLYMDVNHNDGAREIFTKTLENFQIEKGPAYYPMGMVAGAFELGTDFWRQRNVAARLIAVAMGAARLNFTTDAAFWDMYNHTCLETLGLHPSVCDLQGYVAVEKLHYQRQWKNTWTDWTNNICDRLTMPTHKLHLKNKDSNRKTAIKNANEYFWTTFRQTSQQASSLASRDKKEDQIMPATGVILDLVNSMHSFNETTRLLKEFIAPLDIKLVQLRLVDDHAFAVHLDEKTAAGYSPFATLKNPVPSMKDFVPIVRAARELGIEVYPEISLTTNVGGWLETGHVLDCANVLCGHGQNHSIVANDIRRKEFLPIVYFVLRELKQVFSNSNFLHLGFDNRKSSVECFQEAGYSEEEPPFTAFEANLKRLVTDFLGVSTSDIIRWENTEQTRYLDRTGDITQYRPTNPFTVPSVRTGERFFVTIDLLAPFPNKNDPHAAFYDIYISTRELMKLKPSGIFAELRMFNDFTLVNHNVGLRLVSFSIGTTQAAEGKGYSKKEFKEVLTKECHNRKIENCDTVVQNPSQKDALTYHIEHDYTRKRMCDKNTVLGVKRQAKPEMSAGVLLSEAS